MSSAVSSNALVRRLGFFFLVISHLLQSAIVKSLGNCLRIRPQPRGGNFAQCYQFVWLDILPLALGEAVHEHCAMSGAVGDQYPITAGPPLPRSSHPLLDNSPSQVGIDKPLPCPFDRFAQAAIGNPLASRKSHEPSGLEDPQAATPPHRHKL